MIMSERFSFPAVNYGRVLLEALARIDAHERAYYERLELKWTRANALPSLPAAANYLGVSRSTLCLWRGLPPAKRLHRMAKHRRRRL